MDRNALPLITVINTTFLNPSAEHGVQGVATHAAVHGWMEGHLAAPGHPDGPVHPDPATFSVPPFPEPGSPELETIIREVMRRFEDGQEPGAALTAAGLAWAAGHAEGKLCRGCSLVQSRTAVSQAIRAGRGEYRFVPGGPSTA